MMAGETCMNRLVVLSRECSTRELPSAGMDHVRGPAAWENTICASRPVSQGSGGRVQASAQSALALSGTQSPPPRGKENSWMVFGGRLARGQCRPSVPAGAGSRSPAGSPLPWSPWPAHHGGRPPGWARPADSWGPRAGVRLRQLARLARWPACSGGSRQGQGAGPLAGQSMAADWWGGRARPAAPACPECPAFPACWRRPQPSRLPQPEGLRPVPACTAAAAAGTAAARTELAALVRGDAWHGRALLTGGHQAGMSRPATPHPKAGLGV